jgi:hypothetical protein
MNNNNSTIKAYLPFESINKLEHFNPNREKESEEKEKPFRSNIEKRKKEKNNNK